MTTKASRRRESDRRRPGPVQANRGEVAAWVDVSQPRSRRPQLPLLFDTSPSCLPFLRLGHRCSAITYYNAAIASGMKLVMMAPPHLSKTPPSSWQQQ
ncbi:unnamed protein product [Musa acuminata var. zebrina]